MWAKKGIPHDKVRAIDFGQIQGSTSLLDTGANRSELTIRWSKEFII